MHFFESTLTGHDFGPSQATIYNIRPLSSDFVIIIQFTES